MRKKYLCLLIGIWIISLFIMQASALPWDTPQTLNWYVRADTQTVNSQLGYVVNRTQSSTERNVSATDSGDLTVYWSIRVFVRRRNNSTVELTTAYTDIYFTRLWSAGNASGLQSDTWTPPLTSVYIGSDAIVMNVYIQIGTGSWQQVAILITSQLDTNQILNSTWTVRLYTRRVYVAGVTTGYFYWGDSSYESRIEDVQLRTLTPWERQIYHLTQQDFISFIVTPWTYFIGNLFYGVLLLFFVMTSYNKYEDVRPVIAWFWIFGGTGGFLTIMIPTIGLHLSWFFLAFALGTTLFLLFK